MATGGRGGSTAVVRLRAWLSDMSATLRASTAQNGGWSVNQRLTVLTLGALLPTLLFSAYLLTRFAALDHEQYEQRLRQTVTDLAEDIQRELQGMVTILRSLSTSRSLHQQDFEAFHAEASEALRESRFNVAVLSATLQPLVNTAAPFSTPLPPPAELETPMRARDTKQPAISNLFIDALTQRPVLDVCVPIVQNGEVRLILLMPFSPDRILEIMRTRKLTPGWVTGLTDRNGVVIARSERHDLFVGTSLPPDLLMRSRAATDVFEVKNLEGVPVMRAVARVKDAGWMVASTVPLSVVQESARRSWRQLGLVAMLLLAASGLLAFINARALARAVTQTTSAARALGRGEEVPLSPTSVREVTEAAAEISAASRRRRAAENALRAQESRLRLALRAGGLGAWRWATSADVIECDDTFRALLGLPPEPAPVTGRDVRALVHPEDRARVAAARRRLLAGEVSAWNVEVRLLRANDREVRWIAWFGEGEPVTHGRVNSAFGVVQDITERRALEERQALLMREVQHRTKNILAVVQSIVGQTLAPGRSADEAKPVLLGRLRALANATDLAGTGTAATLADVVGRETAAFSGRIDAKGPPVELSSRAAQTFALLIHELVTNASKHGALSTADGRVAVDWSLSGEGDEQRLSIGWRERNGPPVSEPERRGFGYTIIEDVAAQEFGVSPLIEYAPDGFRYRIEAPMSAVNLVTPED